MDTFQSWNDAIKRFQANIGHTKSTFVIVTQAENLDGSGSLQNNSECSRDHLYFHPTYDV